jgi:hypothetical protein
MDMLEAIKNTIVDCCTLFGFEYNGKDGNIDPCYKPGIGDTFLLFYNGEEQSVDSLDAVFSTPFVEGHTLKEIADEIEVTEW